MCYFWLFTHLIRSIDPSVGFYLMTHFSDTELVSNVISIAQQAADKINSIRQAKFDIKIKSDSSPVTEADQASEAIILHKLKALTPTIPIIAEEEIASGAQISTKSEFWLVDPLDGTKGFIQHSDNFTINIGLIRDNKPVLGVVACPAYHEIFYGIVHQGAWKLDKHGKITSIHVLPPPHHQFRVLFSSRCVKNPSFKKFLQLFDTASVERLGSTLKILRIAEGKADLHPRFSPTMEWDTAAPQAILEAAGGVLHDLNNQPLRYGKTDWKNHDFFCSSIPIDPYLKNFHISKN